LKIIKKSWKFYTTYKNKYLIKDMPPAATRPTLATLLIVGHFVVFIVVLAMHGFCNCVGDKQIEIK